MSRHEAISKLQATLASLTTEQAEALAELAIAWTRLPVPEDDATRTAIAEGLAQADRGEFVDARKLDNLLGHPWK